MIVRVSCRPALVVACLFSLTVHAADEPRRAFGRDRSVDMEHVRIDLSVDLAGRSVAGATDVTVRAIHDDTREAKLMAKSYALRAVSVDGRPARHDYDGSVLTVTFDPPLLEDDRRVIRVEYSATPQEGLYFVGDPKKPLSLEAWSQGEREENQAWFPVHDDPGERLTSETLITVPRPYIVVGNGPLLETIERADGRRTFHHRMDFPHVPYLVSIAVGDYATLRAEWAGVEITYHAPRAHEPDMLRSLGNTPEILEFLSQETGVKYPHAVYRQVAVTDYIYGGMENIAATTLTTDTFHPERAHRDRPSDSLVAHEAAHQWFGDMVTCSDWADTWLNEGFATYYAALTMQRLFGEEKWVEEIESMRAGAISADAAKRRPVVWNGYESPDELFDGHGYSKGAMVLHALRRELGDALYRKAVTAWLVEYSGKSADTHAFIATVERATGRDISKLADQWLYRAGEPDLLVSWSHENGDCAVKVKQRQERGPLVGLFDVPLDIELLGDAPSHHEARISSEEETFHFPCATKPKAVLVDPQGWLLRKLEIDRGGEEKRFVLERAPFLMARMDAARDLAEEAGQPRTLEALIAATQPSQPYPLRKAAAEALAKAGADGARDRLLAMLRDEQDSLVRQVVARSLSHYEEPAVARALERTLSSDSSFEVQAEAASSLGAMDLPGLDRPLEAALARRTHRETVFSAALGALAARRSARLRPLALEWSQPGHPQRARQSAMKELGELASREPDEVRRGEIRRHLEKFLVDVNVRVRGSAIKALAKTRDPAARAPLEALRGGSPNPITRSDARAALKDLDKGIAAGSSVDQVRRDLEEEKRERGKLEDRLRKLEARSSTSGESKGSGD